MNLENVIPWGRSLFEYKLMFNLSESDLQGRILGCADGPASFNAELNAKGGSITSVDPIYQFSRAEISDRIDAVFDDVLNEVEENKNQFIWDTIKNVEALGHTRRDSMNKFLADYEKGIREGRYVGGSLPHLPFESKQFDLALCSHYLFLYSDLVDLDHHIESVKLLARIAKELRIYPLVDLNSDKSPHLDEVVRALSHQGKDVSIKPVFYQFQKNANYMLVVKD